MYLPGTCSDSWCQLGSLSPAEPEGGCPPMCVLSCESFLAAVSGADCMDWQPGELSLVPATATGRAALDRSCLKTSLGPAYGKLFTKQSINQLERVYHEPLISPAITPALYQLALAGHLQSWRKPLLAVPCPSVCSLSCTDAAFPSAMTGDSASILCLHLRLEHIFQQTPPWSS